MFDCVRQSFLQTTPLAVAFLKGHVGLADLLLAQPTVDINLRLDSGMTLVSLACSSPLIDGIVDQITYLVITKNADCTIADASNMNAVSCCHRYFRLYRPCDVDEYHCDKKYSCWCRCRVYVFKADSFVKVTTDRFSCCRETFRIAWLLFSDDGVNFRAKIKIAGPVKAAKEW